MMNRRQLLSTIGVASLAPLLSSTGFSHTKERKSQFRYCLNTSTIRGQNIGLRKNIEIASKAGYDGVELWVRDVKEYLDSGKSAASLKRYLRDNHIQVENAIGFAPWLAEEKSGLQQMKSEMEMMAEIGCTRIAAPVAGLKDDKPLDLFKAGECYGQLIELGLQTGVMPQLEFWGASKVFWHIGQAMMIAAVANHPDVRILADVYHMFRGNSGFDSLKMLDGQLLEIFHMNDFIATIPREKQNDSHRVYPGDGVAPFKQILTDLKNIGGAKVLSLELFNKEYWKEDPLVVAQTGIDKMKTMVEEIVQL